MPFPKVSFPSDYLLRIKYCATYIHPYVIIELKWRSSGGLELGPRGVTGQWDYYLGPHILADTRERAILSGT